MKRVVVDWVKPSTEVPDDDILVLLAFEDGSVGTGFRDAGVWRLQDANRCFKAPLWWADMPEAPEEAGL